MSTSVREYAIIYVGIGKPSGGNAATTGGGTIITDGAAHALDGPEHTHKGDIAHPWGFIDGGSLAPTAGSPPVGEIVVQVETAGPPSHTATRGTPCWDAVGEQLYVNSDGATSWVKVGISDILDLLTSETDTTLVLAPDGAGGVEFRPEATHAAADITYDNSGSGLSATDVQAAIDEVAASIPTMASDLLTRYEPHVAYDGTVVLDGNGDPVMVEVSN